MLFALSALGVNEEGDLPVGDDVLGEDSLGLHHQLVRGELHH